ncbi:hypothetical protein [Microvirga thermotolerans]|uniref:Uncharacterized protein n=1 Tax=Microvirga thermotolerans TaxID=2651334 RepID=A0A5P9JV65_9HYPH|nr:hypothetical protein [Microvirga thermotolerans]QFU15668.1 hypothetical protein GDR74_05245 [Microvirga thermotolerans]
MADIISLADLRKSAKQEEILSLFQREAAANRVRRRRYRAEFPTARPGISGNLNDLYEQASAVLTRHYDGDGRVPAIVAEKCLELLKALSEHAQPE